MKREWRRCRMMHRSIRTVKRCQSFFFAGLLHAELGNIFYLSPEHLIDPSCRSRPFWTVASRAVMLDYLSGDDDDDDAVVIVDSSVVVVPVVETVVVIVIQIPIPNTSSFTCGITHDLPWAWR